jgi:hypothetical protein
MNKNLTHIKYISSDDEDVRAELVSRKDFPAQLFKGVACDDSKKVKLALLDNHNPNAEVVSKLCADDDIEVRAKAYDKLCDGGSSS